MKQSLVNLSYFLREIASRIVVAESSDGLQLPHQKRTVSKHLKNISFHYEFIKNPQKWCMSFAHANFFFPDASKQMT